MQERQDTKSSSAGDLVRYKLCEQSIWRFELLGLVSQESSVFGALGLVSQT